jgi:hypothetical protein
MPGQQSGEVVRYSTPAHAHASPPNTGGAPNSAPTNAGTNQTEDLSVVDRYMISTYGREAFDHYRKAQQAGAEMKRELADAHRAYKSTGKVPQTKVPFLPIEVKEGRVMDRSERYDAMLKKQGKTHAEMDDVIGDYRNADYLTKEEFKAEFDSRRKAERQACKDDNIRPGTIHKCQEKVNEKYGGHGYKDWRVREARKTYQEIQRTGQKIDAVKNSGPGGLAGRVVGRAVGGEKGEEIGATIGGGFDLGIKGRIARGGGGGGRSQSTPSRPSGRNTGAEVRSRPPTEPPAPPSAPSTPAKTQGAGRWATAGTARRP